MSFNPFDKPVHELQKEDLEILVKKEVAEGYWIEYKSIFQENRKVAKSISSFANTYGGWYFIGIEARNNVASKLVGVNLKEIRDPADKLREIIKSHIDPIPVFHHKVVQLDNIDQVVVVVHIPDDQETPFIVSDGRIYRREGDSSNPISENHRYAVDLLVENGRKKHQEFIDFCKDDRVFSQVEEGQSWVSIYLSPYPLGLVDKIEMLTKESIRDVISLSQKPMKHALQSQNIASTTLPFNTGQYTTKSVVLRQGRFETLMLNGLEAELFIDGRAKFHIPLSYISLSEIDIKSKETKNSLVSVFRSEKEDVRFFDIRQTLAVVMHLLTFYEIWCGDDIKRAEIQVALAATNMWRTIPFFDSDDWGIYVKQHGLPIQNKDSFRIPGKQGIKTPIPLWNTICPMLAYEFGIPLSLYSRIAL